MVHTQKMTEQKLQLQVTSATTTGIFCSDQLRQRLTVLTFIINLFYFPAAYLHLMTASLCKNYQNLVKNTKPIYNFKGTIEPLQNNLVIFALINLSLLIVNAAIILFSYKIKRFWVYFIPLGLTVLGMAVSMGAPINVMLTVKEWNNLNQSSFNTFTVYSSVFVGDLSGIQTLFRLQILLGWLVFFTSTIYTGIYWIILLRDKYIINKKKSETDTQKRIQLQDNSQFAKQKQQNFEEKVDLQ